MTDMRFKGTLLVCDMDKTLLNFQSKVSNRNRAALLRFTENGGLFTIATGRMEKAVKPYVKDLPLNAPAVLCNGAMIHDFSNNKIIWQKCLENKVYDIIKDIYDVFDDVGIELYSDGNIYIIRENTETEKHISREKLSPILCNIDEIPFPWIKVLLACENSRLKEVEAYLKDKSGNFRTVFSEPQFLEVVEASVSKGYALTKLTDIVGLCTRTVTVGDNLNDVELIKYADVGIAVENAHPALKKVADLCCCHHDEDAIAQVIEWIEAGK